MEEGVSYPLGDDSFSIDHGADYFAFFERLGEVRYDLVIEGSTVVAVVARVLRTLSLGPKPTRCWYLCDLKVLPAYRGRRISTLLAKHSFLTSYKHCPRGYAVTMNPPRGTNRVVRLIQRLPLVPVKASAELLFFSLSAAEMERAHPLVIEHRGPIAYRALRGIKDIVLESTGQPMKLLHVQFGPTADPAQEQTEADATHMFCSPKSDALAQALLAKNFEVSATATVLSHGMNRTNFNFVLTSEI